MEENMQDNGNPEEPRDPALPRKPKYEAPVVVSFGQLAHGHGVSSCHSGTTASDCSTGGRASNNCNDGMTAGVACGPGGTPKH